MRRLSTHPEKGRKHTNKESFINSVLAVILSLNSGFVITMGELLQTKERPQQSLRTMSERELIDALKYDLHILAEKIFMGEPIEYNADEKAGSDVAPVVMAKEAVAKVIETGEKAMNAPSEAKEDIQCAAKESTQWCSTYRASLETHLPPEKTDCNDHANRACEWFHNQGLQSYLASIWPEDPKKRLDKSWHQIAVLRTGEEEYLVVDNNQLIRITGSFSSFIQNYHKFHNQETSMRLIPHIGLSPYRKPKHEYPLVKMVHQGLFALGTDERDMEIANLRESYPSRQLLALQK